MVTKRLKIDNRRKSTDRDYQFKICLWIALRKTTLQIVDLLRDRFDIEMTYQNIDSTYRYGKKWKPIIEYLRKKYLNNISRIPIANKAFRLAIIQEAAEEALTYHTKSINEFGTIEEKQIGLIPALAREARKEVEGEKPLVDNSKHYYYTQILRGIAKQGDNGKPTPERASVKRGSIEVIG